MPRGEHVSIWSIPERHGRGPRPAYSRAQITAAAVGIADADGLEAASMRRIAAELRTGPMSLYRYVPSREHLVELMIDHVLAEVAPPERPSGDWRADLTLLAVHTRAMWLRHPWLADMHRPRATLGPNRLRLLEFALGALDAGLAIDDRLVLLDMLNGYVEHVVRGEIDGPRGNGGGTVPEAAPGAWTLRGAPHVRELVAAGGYPMLELLMGEARLPRMGGDERFAFGLARVLDRLADALPHP